MTVESLTILTEDQMLEQVKAAINLTGNDYQDGTIKIWIADTKQDLLLAGVSPDILESTLAVGCISRGVDDKWASHRDDYSPMFYSLAERLRNTKVKGAE
jgi:hypothetical protein